MNELCNELSAALAVAINNKDGYNDYFSASVLVPLVWDNGEISVLFEVRSTQLSWQPGEICFPGGRIENGDKNPLFAAVRETQEELALSKEDIQVLGPLEEILSPIGVRLHPYVGYLSPKQSITPNAGEVAEVFTVPLEYLINYDPIIGHMEMGTRPLEDFPFALVPGYSQEWRVRKKYQVLFYKYKEYVIWGLTAQVLKRFLDVCKKIGSEDK
ncbi:CoA pyrophosphatase [Pelosinus sp. IPA-1]|uniref:NUDIX hydrolase n=1 Tax=Pelosinus sp. IPA-1 TaxID=3029569 RepID=UPI0025531899|nr:CoA pyrophosphatase [Pelosinus sp. IPA-1]